MSDQWYRMKGEQKRGPFSFEQLQQMAVVGVLTSSDMVFNEGACQWVPARDVPGLEFASPQPTMARRAEPASEAVPITALPQPRSRPNIRGTIGRWRGTDSDRSRCGDVG